MNVSIVDTLLLKCFEMMGLLNTDDANDYLNSFHLYSVLYKTYL